MNAEELKAEIAAEIAGYVASPQGTSPPFLRLDFEDGRGVWLNHVGISSQHPERYELRAIKDGRCVGPLITVRPDGGPVGISGTRLSFEGSGWQSLATPEAALVDLLAGLIVAIAGVSA